MCRCSLSFIYCGSQVNCTGGKLSFFCMRNKVWDSFSCFSSKLSSHSENFVPPFCWCEGLCMSQVTLAVLSTEPRVQDTKHPPARSATEGKCESALFLLFLLSFSFDCSFFLPVINFHFFPPFPPFFPCILFLCLCGVFLFFPSFSFFPSFLCFFLPLLPPLHFFSLFPLYYTKLYRHTTEFLLQNNDLDFFFLFCNCSEMFITHCFSHLE